MLPRIGFLFFLFGLPLLGQESGFGLLAQQVRWATSLAGQEATVRPLGFFPYDQDRVLLLFKADRDLKTGRKSVLVTDSSGIQGLVVSASGEISLPDSLPGSILRGLPSVHGNQWLLKSQEQNGNYFLAYGLSTPLSLPTNLNWSLAFLDGNGHRLWEFHLDPAIHVRHLELVPGGKCLVVGSEKRKEGDLNIFFALWNEYGQELWHRSLGGKSDDVALTACHDAEGNLFIGGYFSADSSFLGNTRDLSGREKDGFIACYDLSGKEKFFYRQRGEGTSSVSMLYPGTLGNVVFGTLLNGKDWRLPPFGIPRSGKQDLILGSIDPRLGQDKENPLKVFPNPARELVYFGLEKPLGKGPLRATLHQKDGTVLQEMMIGGAPGTSFRFNVSNTRPGAYFVTVKGKGKSITERVVVE